MNTNHTLRSVFTNIPPQTFNLTILDPQWLRVHKPKNWGIYLHSGNHPQCNSNTRVRLDVRLLGTRRNQRRSTNPYTLTMNAGHSIKAVFKHISLPTYILTVQSPEGSGSTNPSYRCIHLSTRHTPSGRRHSSRGLDLRSLGTRRSQRQYKSLHRRHECKSPVESHLQGQ